MNEIATLFGLGLAELGQGGRQPGNDCNSGFAQIRYEVLASRNQYTVSF